MMTSTKAQLAETNAEQNGFIQKKQTHSAGVMTLLLLIWLVGTAVLAIGVVWSTPFMKNATQVAQAPAAKRFKIKQMPPQKLPRQPTTDAVNTQPPGTPAPGISSPEETPSRESAALTKAPASRPSVTDMPMDSNPAQEKVSKIQPQEDRFADTADSTLSEPTAAQPATGADRGNAGFNLQVGAFRKETNALDTMEKLLKNGYDSFIFKATGSRQRIWHTVRIGRYNSYKEAASSLERFVEKENIVALVVKAGKL
jgi:cell division protein FtsN